MKRTFMIVVPAALLGIGSVAVAQDPINLSDEKMDEIVGAGSLTISPAVPCCLTPFGEPPAGPIATNRTKEVNDNAQQGLDRASNGPGIEVFNPG